MSGPTWGHCEDCGGFASLAYREGAVVDGSEGAWLCPACRWKRDNPGLAPLY